MNAARTLTTAIANAAVRAAPGWRERCGAEASRHVDYGACITCCDQRAGVPVPARPGRERLRIVRTMEHGKPRVESCRRYDRNRDDFIDVSVPPGAGEES